MRPDIGQNCLQRGDPLAGKAGRVPGTRVKGLEIAERAGVETSVIDHTAYETREDFDAALLACALFAASLAAVERRLYVSGAAPDTATGELSVPAELGVLGNTVCVAAAVWPGELVVAFQVAPEQSRASEATVLGATLGLGVIIGLMLRRR